MTWSCTCVTYAHEPSTQCACIVSMYLGAINRRQLYVSPISVYALRTRKGCAEPCRVLHVSSWITSDIAFGCVSVHNKVDVGCCVDYSKSNANRSIVKHCALWFPLLAGSLERIYAVSFLSERLMQRLRMPIEFYDSSDCLPICIHGLFIRHIQELCN